MRVIIAGGRDFKDWGLFSHVWAKHRDDITTLVTGGAEGADQMAERYAEEDGLHTAQFLPDWNAHGKAAGPRRNERMAQYAEVLIAFWNGTSKGTKNMISEALRYGLEVHVYRYKGEDDGNT